MTDFKVALDPRNPRCMVHPDQRLLLSHDANPRAKSIWTCPICNAKILDEMAQRPDVIRLMVGKDKER
jgi:hypothetical protein